MTERCPNCGVDYPEEILTPLVTSQGNTKPVCGICGLAIMNEVHGARRRKFAGERAEALRQAAIEWRRQQGVQP